VIPADDVELLLGKSSQAVVQEHLSSMQKLPGMLLLLLLLLFSG
jgi:hypothetical protein